jgi:hypothetical protein
MSTTVKTYTLQPQLDIPAQSRIRFPLWLKCLYNIAQMELTTIDPLGAFYLVALDDDWKLRPQNIKRDRGATRARRTITMPNAYAANASAGTIGAYSIASKISNYNNGLQPIFVLPFVPASAVLLSSRSIRNTNSAPGLSLL